MPIHFEKYPPAIQVPAPNAHGRLFAESTRVRLWRLGHSLRSSVAKLPHHRPDKRASDLSGSSRGLPCHHARSTTCAFGVPKSTDCFSTAFPRDLAMPSSRKSDGVPQSLHRIQKAGDLVPTWSALGRIPRSRHSQARLIVFKTRGHVVDWRSIGSNGRMTVKIDVGKRCSPTFTAHSAAISVSPRIAW